MKRRPLSSKLVIAKITVITVFIVLIVFAFNCNPDSRELFLPAIPVMTGIGYIIFYVPDYIEYDNDKIYIIRRSMTYVINLQDIYMVKMTAISFGQQSLWKIKFVTNGEDNAVRFYNRFFYSPLDDFFRRVKSKNHKAELVKFSWSFDFDT